VAPAARCVRTLGPESWHFYFSSFRSACGECASRFFAQAGAAGNFQPIDPAREFDRPRKVRNLARLLISS
jgi:hypothetical protein